ncbi:hypothetical protein DPMN_147438 [Dreissena polymorpha]|uniref:Uncharacterized protein n=1 Tax=Dreissena polymorpha TaxID=45954 RepID=A0A9D4F8C4_DREPO|nr:hypothetical protein DPMN_147438 [Dreissena polymorpha]
MCRVLEKLGRMTGIREKPEYEVTYQPLAVIQTQHVVTFGVVESTPIGASLLHDRKIKRRVEMDFEVQAPCAKTAWGNTCSGSIVLTRRHGYVHSITLDPFEKDQAHISGSMGWFR